MKKLLAVWLLISVLAFGALPATSVWEIRPTSGADTNGGGFVSGASGTDFSQQAAAQQAYTDLIIGATTTQLTSVAHPFGATVVGNFIQITGGAGCTVGIYSVSSESVITATMDRSVGTAASTCSGNMGGALATIGKMNSNATQGNITWVKATGTISVGSSINITYSSSASTNTSTQISGYTTTRGDNGVVTLQASGGVSPMVNIQNNVGGLTFRNFVFDCNSTNSSAVNIQGSNGPNIVENILVKGGCTNATGAITFNNSNHMCIRCTVTGYNASGGNAFLMEQGNGPNICIDCLAVSALVNSAGFKGSQFTCVRCISGNNVGVSSDGFLISANTGAMFICFECVAYKNGRDGFRFAPSSPVILENVISYGNTGVGINDTTGVVPAGGYNLNWNGYGGNTGGNLTNVSAGTNDVTLSVDPFVAGASNNFALNNTVGGGKSLRAAGYPGILANGGTAIGGTGNIDIGALQSAAAAGAGQVGFAIIQ